MHISWDILYQLYHIPYANNTMATYSKPSKVWLLHNPLLKLYDKVSPAHQMIWCYYHFNSIRFGCIDYVTDKIKFLSLFITNSKLFSIEKNTDAYVATNAHSLIQLPLCCRSICSYSFQICKQLNCLFCCGCLVSYSGFLCYIYFYFTRFLYLYDFSRSSDVILKITTKDARTKL